MVAAIFGLLGVAVGASINGAVSAALDRKAEQALSRSAARLIRSELLHYRSLAFEASVSSPQHLPQLRDVAPVLWHAHRVNLARSTTASVWEVVARAYAYVDALTSVLVFESDGTLAPWRSREARRILAAMISPLDEAAGVLGGTLATTSADEPPTLVAA